MKFENNFKATSVGSFPHKDPERALGLIFKYTPQIPAWPQLPKTNFKESMYSQFAEGLPCLVEDESEKKIWLDTSKNLESELEKFYQKVLADDVEYFRIEPQRAKGFYAFLDQAAKIPKKELACLKGQLTGPVSFGLSITDQNKKAILYDEQIHPALVKTLSMKARWQIRQLKKLHDEVIIFVDEPYLVSIGSSFVSLNKDQVVSDLNQVLDSIKNEGAISGIHCCGNTDWSLLAKTNTRIISFDAYHYSESLSLYSDSLKEFLANGGIIAWGIVPTNDRVEKENASSLYQRLKKSINLLVEKGIDKDLLYKQALLTPSCGTGTLSEKQAELCMRLLHELSLLASK